VPNTTQIVSDTGLLSEKVFMLPDMMRIRAANKMWLKHNLQLEASEMNIVPNLHSMLISVPKMADADYIAVFNKKEVRIYNAKHPLCTMLPGHRTVETRPRL
jgi:hypothetical protein